MSLSLLLWICHNQTQILKAPSLEGAFLFQRTPLGKAIRGWGTGDGGVVVAESLDKPYHLVASIFFGSDSLIIELGTRSLISQECLPQITLLLRDLAGLE